MSAEGSEAGPPPEKRARLADEGEAFEPFGEIRFDEASSVPAALALTGTTLGGGEITVTEHPTSKEGVMVLVKGFGPTVRWQELKDHFKPCGRVANSDVVRQQEPSPTEFVGQVRMRTSEEAERAIQMLDGSSINDATIKVKLHTGSKDSTKLVVTGVPPGVSWQDLKDHFSACGSVAHSDVLPAAGADGLTGEVRYFDSQHALIALETLQGSTLGTSQIRLEMDPWSTDHSKLCVKGIGPEVDWQELKDHFATIGDVAYADVHRLKGKGKGKWGGKMEMMELFFHHFSKGFYGGFGGKGKGKGKGSRGRVGKLTGSVHYESAESAEVALEQLQGHQLNDSELQLDKDWNSTDGTKIWVGGIAPGTSSQELQELFAPFGTLVHAGVRGGV